MSPLPVVAACVLAYLVGAIPSGLLIGKATHGVDLRTVGSKNIGFTNAWRVLGAGPGIAVLIADVGKALAAAWFLPRWFDHAGWAYLYIAVAFCVMLGNMVNVFLKGGGGKGIGTGLGVFAALSPWGIAAGLVVFGVLLALFRYISLGALAATVTLCAVSWFKAPQPVFWLTALMTVIVFYKHRENIKRLLAGTERKFGRAGTERVER